MLQGLNATIHTRHINATLSSFSDNWCGRHSLPSCATAPAVAAAGVHSFEVLPRSSGMTPDMTWHLVLKLLSIRLHAITCDLNS